MSGDIFADNAQAYWARDLPIIPLEPETKQPAKGLTGWQGFAAAMPNEETKARWLTDRASCGIGALMGIEVAPGQMLIGIDVDDDRWVKPVVAFLGLNRAGLEKVLSAKRGKKGLTVFAQTPKEKALKSTTLEGVDEFGNIDVLASGKMTVMPPSIHPNTGQAYAWEGTPLPEADLTRLPVFSRRHLNVLKVFLGSAHTIVMMGGENTHEAGVSLVASLMSAGATDEEIEDTICALLPDGYKGNSLKELPGWITSARAKGFGDKEETEGRETQAAMIVALATREGIELFHDDDTAYAAVPLDAGAITYRVTSGGFKSWLRFQAFNTLDKPIGTTPLNEAIATIEAMALFGKQRRPVHIRVAGNLACVEIDLGTADGRVVSISPQGWDVKARASHNFLRGAGFDSLPEPKPGGNLRDLQTLLGLDEDNFRLLVAFLLNALRPDGPYMILLVEGEQGSGKSFFCEVIKRIIDNNMALRLRLPDNEKDLMIQAKEYRLLNFDNASGMKADMSDVLCALATGGGIAVRKLYTDGDLHVMSLCRPFVINGIAGYANRPDLMERAIPIKLSPLPDGGRKTEEEMLAAFVALLPGVLGALYDGVAGAMARFEAVEPPRHLRMADAARWIKAGEEALGFASGVLIETIAKAQTEFVVEKVNDEPLTAKLRMLSREKPFEGYVADVFASIDFASEKGMPSTPSALSKLLRRLRPALEKAGVFVEFLGKDRRGQKIRVTLDRDNLGPAMF